jgi:hypothetical protein
VLKDRDGLACPDRVSAHQIRRVRVVQRTKASTEENWARILKTEYRERNLEDRTHGFD